MLSLEWELSVETLRQLEAEIAAQQTRWEGDKSVTGLLRILGALGKYIGRIQALTHPLAIKLFFAVYNGLEKIVLSPDMSEGKKKKIVLLAYQRYNQVKEQLTLREKLIAQQREKAVASSSPAGRISIQSVDDTGSDGNNCATDRQTVAPFEGDVAESGESDGPAVEKVSDDPAVESRVVTPALGDFDFSDEDEQKRKIWLESGDSGDLSSRLATFFKDDSGENGLSAIPEAADASTSLPETKNEKPETGELDAQISDGEEAAISKTGEAKSGVIDELFLEAGDRPEDQVLTDMHLSVFSSEGEIPAPVSLQNTQQYDSDTGDKSQLDTQVTEKLNAFFDETASEESAVAAENEKKALPADRQPAEKVSEEAFAGDLQAKLDSFFDEEGQVEDQIDADVVPLQQTARPGGANPADLLQELLKEIRQQSDGFKHFPEEEERGLLANLFERVEKTCQAMPEVIIPLCLLKASLFAFDGSKEPTCTGALECAAELSGIICPVPDSQVVDKKDLVMLISPLERFLALVGADRPRPQVETDSNKSAHGNTDYRGARDLLGEKTPAESQYKTKGDLIIEDLFADE